MYNLEWKNSERQVIAESYDPVEAWENYRVTFGDFRTFEAIEREWYRAHPKLDVPADGISEKEYTKALEELELLVSAEGVPA